MAKHECDCCGACCQGPLIVQADWIDVVREPRLKDADHHFQGQRIDKVLEMLEDGMRAVTLACGQACPFLSAEKTCSIYPTRPNDCVAMQAGVASSVNRLAPPPVCRRFCRLKSSNKQSTGKNIFASYGCESVTTAAMPRSSNALPCQFATRFATGQLREGSRRAV